MLNILRFTPKLIITVIFAVIWATLIGMSVIESRRDEEAEISRSIFGSTKAKIGWASLALACIVFIVL